MSARRTHRTPSTSSTISSTPPLSDSGRVRQGWEEKIYFEILHKLHIAIRTLNDPAAVRHTLAEVVRLVEDASVMTSLLNQQAHSMIGRIKLQEEAISLLTEEVGEYVSHPLGSSEDSR